MERQEKTPLTRSELFNHTIEAYQHHVTKMGLLSKFILVRRDSKLDVLNILAENVDKEDPRLLGWSQRLIISLETIRIPVGKVVNMNSAEYEKFLREPTKKKNGEPNIKRLAEFKCLCDQ